jgi:hypothetical protein
VLLQKSPDAQLLKNFPKFHVTRRFSIVFTRAIRWSLSWATSIQSVQLHPTSPTSNLILFPHLRLPSGLFLWLSRQILMCFPILSHTWYTPYQSHPPWLDHSNCICQGYELWRNFLQPPNISSLFGPNILLSTLFSNTFSPCYSLSVRGQISHPSKITSKIIVLYILIFMFSDSRREDKSFCAEW